MLRDGLVARRPWRRWIQCQRAWIWWIPARDSGDDLAVRRRIPIFSLFCKFF
uniref:Uncharacterized protein n=1 Tax=Arundo donax TaxID=35708 RepID=A0A0A8YTJ4_ARUDO